MGHLADTDYTTEEGPLSGAATPWQLYYGMFPEMVGGLGQPGMEGGFDYGYTAPQWGNLAGGGPVGGGYPGMGGGGGYGGGFGAGGPAGFFPRPGAPGASPYPPSQSFNPFDVGNLWGPMAQQMQDQSKAQMGRLREEFGAGGGRFSSYLGESMAGGLRKSSEDMNRMMSQLQYQDAQNAYQRQLGQQQFGLQEQLGLGQLGLGLGQAQADYNRQLQQSMWQQSMQERGLSQDALDRALQDWMRRQTWGTDQALKFLGPGYQPDYLAKPKGQDPSFMQEYGPALIALVGAFAASDKNIKQDVKDVDKQETLQKIMDLPISEWSYIFEPDARHVGPMAQDFKEAFGTGTSDKVIAMVDEGGVALLGIQALADQFGLLNAQVKKLTEQVA